MTIKVKICGITNMEDATWAVNLGASFVGFNFWHESPRKVSEKNAKDIIAKMPVFVHSVGVFVNAEPAEIESAARKTKIQYVQLHGIESPAYCSELKTKGIKIIKAFRIKDDPDIEQMKEYLDCAEYFLLDTYREDIPGGTGETFNWDAAMQVKELVKKPFFLAGGLTPENVIEALEKVMPYGADVCSGIEKSPRRKDYQRMKDFVMNVNEAY